MEDNEQNRLLRQTLEMEKENNRLLRKLRRDATVGRIMTLIFWGITLGVPVVLYYFFVAPYVKALQATYQGLEQNARQVQTLEANLPPWAKEWLQKTLGSGTSTPSR